MVFVGFFVLLYMCLFCLVDAAVFIFCFSSMCCFYWVYIFCLVFCSPEKYGCSDRVRFDSSAVKTITVSFAYGIRKDRL